ncbi:MAG: GTP-binding protein [Nitrospirae bacterium]|nr:GTP-binding protein [Nitrospirota bacterium]
MVMKTTIVCGMLGSGKTTFIRQFVGNIKGKTVVLVNDFGKAGIDGEIFSANGIESIELPSGCVCCTLKFDLIASIEKIRETFAPEHIIIEPSGIASPSGVLEALETLKIGAVMVIGIVDASEFLDLNHEDAFGRFFKDQITNSDIVLVNKTDLVEKESAERTVHAVEQINPNAIVLSTVNCITNRMLPNVSDAERSLDRNVPHFQLDTLSLKLVGSIDHEWLSDFFQDMSFGKYGDIVRAKALVNTLQGPYQFDLSFTNIKSVPFEKTVTGSRLVIIGKDIRKDALMRIFPSSFAFL